MPIFIKCIFVLWVVTFVGWMFAGIWAVNHVWDIAKGEYPIWTIAVGILFILSVLSVVPLFVYLLFFR